MGLRDKDCALVVKKGRFVGKTGTMLYYNCGKGRPGLCLSYKFCFYGKYLIPDATSHYEQPDVSVADSGYGAGKGPGVVAR